MKALLHDPQENAQRGIECRAITLHEQEVLYLTERASIRLTAEGIELFEIAPGIDLQRDVLDQMDFVPRMAADLSILPVRHFMVSNAD